MPGYTVASERHEDMNIETLSEVEWEFLYTNSPDFRSTDPCRYFPKCVLVEAKFV